MGRPIRVQHDE